ncbi:MFS transporter, partial [Phycicoccus elongatus]
MTSTAVGRDPVPLSAGYREITVAVLAMVTIVAFEAMSVSTAMPDVARELRAVRGYGLAFSVMLTAQLLGIVLAGVWSDRSGPLPGTFAGQGLVAVGSAICGLATSYPIFLVGRVVTGLGGGLLVVMLYVIAARVYPESVRPRLFSLMSAAWVLPSLVGPSIAAWLTQTFSWRWVFLVVVPPVVVAVAFFARTRRRLGDETTTGEVSHRDAGAHRRAAWSG